MGALLLALGMAASAGTTGASSTPYTPRVAADALGVNGSYLWQYPSWYRQAHLREMAATGINVVRREANWSEIEPSAPMGGLHNWQWGGYDSWASDVAGAGVRWEPILGYSATWASSNPWAGNQSQFFAPANDTDFANYATAFAQRYGRGGAFWTAHPELTANPVTTYEIWNEENSTGFWNYFPDPARYASLFVAASRAILAVDPQATVLVGGLARAPWTGTGYYKDTDYVAAMYQAHPELHGLVGGIGYHPYSAKTSGYVSDVLSIVAAMRAALASAPVLDPLVPIYVTEIGWSTYGSTPLDQVVLTEQQRADAISSVADQLIRSDCGVKQVLVHTWMSPEGTAFPGVNPTDKDGWTGIANLDATLKPTAVAYTNLVQNLEGRGPTAPNYGVVPLCSPGVGVPTTATSSPPTTSPPTTVAPTTTTTVKATSPTTLPPPRRRWFMGF